MNGERKPEYPENTPDDELQKLNRNNVKLSDYQSYQISMPTSQQDTDLCPNRF